jgi:hypothetical protein
MLTRVFCLAISVLLTACSYQSPPRTDPLADLLGGIKPVDAPVRGVMGAKDKTLALIVSTSSETQIKAREELDTKYVEGYIKSWEPRSYPIVKAMYDSVAPRALIEGTLLELRSRFKNVVVVNDFADFRDRKLDIAAVVDLGIEGKYKSNPAENAAAYITDITLHFFDPQLRRLGIASGIGSDAGSRSNASDLKYLFNPFLPGPRPEELVKPLIDAELRSRQAAFQKLKASLDEVVR